MASRPQPDERRSRLATAPKDSGKPQQHGVHLAGSVRAEDHGEFNVAGLARAGDQDCGAGQGPAGHAGKGLGQGKNQAASGNEGHVDRREERGGQVAQVVAGQEQGGARGQGQFGPGQADLRLGELDRSPRTRPWAPRPSGTRPWPRTRT